MSFSIDPNAQINVTTVIDGNIQTTEVNKKQLIEALTVKGKSAQNWKKFSAALAIAFTACAVFSIGGMLYSALSLHSRTITLACCGVFFGSGLVTAMATVSYEHFRYKTIKINELDGAVQGSYTNTIDLNPDNNDYEFAVSLEHKNQIMRQIINEITGAECDPRTGVQFASQPQLS